MAKGQALFRASVRQGRDAEYIVLSNGGDVAEILFCDREEDKLKASST
jgi:hypothetical protein